MVLLSLGDGHRVYTLKTLSYVTVARKSTWKFRGNQKSQTQHPGGRSGSQKKTKKMTIRVVLNIFLVAETKPDKSNVRKEGFVSVHGSRESGPP